MDYCKESKLDKAMDAIEDTAEKGAVHFRQEVTSFFMQTSIKGVPRAIKSTNKKLKVVWAIGVLVLLGKINILLPNIQVDKIQNSPYKYDFIKQWDHLCIKALSSR